MTSPDPVKLQVQYRYLLVRNHEVFPLIAASDLPPSTTEVSPPTDLMAGITFVREVIALSGEDSGPGMCLLSSGGQLPFSGGHEGYESKNNKNDRIGTTPSGPPHTCLSPPTKMHTCVVVGPSPSQVDQQQVVQGIDDSYLHSNHSPARLEKDGPVSPSPLLQETLTAREPRLKVSELSGEGICQSSLRDSVCELGNECTFRHNTPLRPEKSLESGRGRALDAAGPSEEAACGQKSDRGTSDDRQCPSDNGGDGGGDGEKEECEVGNRRSATAAATIGRGPCGTDPKLKKSEPCTYFYRKVGCKRGKDCFYTHDNESGFLEGDERRCPKNSSRDSSTNSSASNPKNKEGGWRKTVESPTSDKGEGSRKLPPSTKVAEASKRKGIACSTPDRVPSTVDPLKHVKTHCTFFLRFGECDYWPSCKFSHERPEGLLTPPPPLSPTPAAGFTRWRTNKIPLGPSGKGSGVACVKKILPRDKRIEGITKPPASGMVRLATGGRLSLLDKTSGDAGLQAPIGTTTRTGEVKPAIIEGQLITLAD